MVRNIEVVEKVAQIPIGVQLVRSPMIERKLEHLSEVDKQTLQVKVVEL